MAYVEVKAKTIELAIEAAMRELGVDSRDRLEVEIIQEPERGFLGFGGQDAIVKVTEKQEKRSRSRSRKRSKSKTSNNQSRSESSEGGKARNRGKAPAAQSGDNRPARKANVNPEQSKPKPAKQDSRPDLSIAEQEPVVVGFLQGLLDSLGLEGQVESRIEDDVIVANVVGEQTEALVGPRGSVMEAVHELTKTVLQRATQAPARVRIDIAGYAERRRQALTIYAGDLIRQVLEEGGELMLEPMSAADRKVIHDAVAAHDGVRSYSEGEAPNRYVVIAAEETREAESSESPEPEIWEEEGDSSTAEAAEVEAAVEESSSEE